MYIIEFFWGCWSPPGLISVCCLPSIDYDMIMTSVWCDIRATSYKTKQRWFLEDDWEVFRPKCKALRHLLHGCNGTLNTKYGDWCFEKNDTSENCGLIYIELDDILKLWDKMRDKLVQIRHVRTKISCILLLTAATQVVGWILLNQIDL